MKALNKWLPLLAVWVIAALSIRPVLERPQTAWAWGGDDGIIVWQINQIIENIPEGIDRLFSGNILYPYKNTAAFTVLLVPSAILAYLPVKLTGNPVVAFNVAMIVAQFLTVTVLYWWWKELSENRWVAAVATMAFMLSPIRMYFDVHIHMWIMQWFLVSSWMLWRYARNKQVWQLYIAGLFLAIQVYESIYQAFWILIMAVILLWPVRTELKQKLKHLEAIVLGVGVLTGPAAWAYFSVFRQFKYAGSIREAANFSMSLNDLWGKFLSPGLYILLIVALIKIRSEGGKKLAGRLKKEAGWLIVLLVLGAVMAMGPVLKWNEVTVKIGEKIFLPLPYGLLYYLVPGVSILRSVHRYIWLFGLAASGLISLGLRNADLRIKKAVLWGLILVAIAGGGKPAARGDFPKPADYPPVYSWLSSQPGQVILEYPVYTWADGEKHGLEMYRMVYSLKHKKNLINGAAGFMPPERGDLLNEIIRDFPGQEMYKKLEELGVNYVVVHKNETDEIKLEEIMADKRLVKVWEDAATVVFSL